MYLYLARGVNCTETVNSLTSSVFYCCSHALHRMSSKKWCDPISWGKEGRKCAYKFILNPFKTILLVDPGSSVQKNTLIKQFNFGISIECIFFLF
jgi:hypothetical protein